jgi:hypothetical protein
VTQLGHPLLAVAASKMTGVRCYVDVDPGELARTLAPLGAVELAAPEGRQVCCELWRVTEGRILAGGLERREWAMVARELGHLAGGFWGASTAWAWGARRARQAALVGSARMGDFMERQALDATRWTVIEPYHELLVSVPDVRYAGSPAPVSVVLGMTTDSPLALKIDSIAYYGYDKRLTEFSTDGLHDWEVRLESRPFLRATFEPTGRLEADIDRTAAASGTIQPLLGGLRSRRPMLAELRRDLRTSGDELHEVEGTIEFGRELFPSLLSGLHQVRSRGAPPRRVSVGFRELETFVTYPWPPRQGADHRRSQALRSYE